MGHAIEPTRRESAGPAGGVHHRRLALWLGLALTAVLPGRVVPGAEAPPGAGVLSARQEGDTIAVTCRGGLSWKAVVDRTYGGVVRHFSIPDDGPNLVADEL